MLLALIEVVCGLMLPANLCKTVADSFPRSFLAFSLSAACLKFFAFRFRAAPPGDDPTLIDA
jgi:hypothetical protein